MTVNFKNGDTVIMTMYVKKADVTAGKLSEVLYDPGVPVTDGKKFLGWTEAATYDLTTERLTIDGVRAAVETKLNNGITEGTVVNYQAIMVTSFELYYQDEHENTYKTENLLTVTNSATTTVDQNYTVQSASATTGFIGWVVKGTETPVYKNGDQITLTADTTLVPKLGQGKWFYFDESKVVVAFISPVSHQKSFAQ